MNQIKLFNIFIQINPNILQNGNGSGIGLWLSKQIAELHEGQVGVESEGEGCGSCFYVEIPCIEKNSNNNSHDDYATDETNEDGIYKLKIPNKKSYQNLISDSSNETDLSDIFVVGVSPSEMNKHKRFVTTPTLRERFTKSIVKRNISANEFIKNDIIPINSNEDKKLSLNRRAISFNINHNSENQNIISDEYMTIKKYKILCCDDMLLIRKMIERSLNNIIDIFDHANNGLEAIKKIQSHGSNINYYHMILIDAYMPQVCIYSSLIKPLVLTYSDLDEWF